MGNNPHYAFMCHLRRLVPSDVDGKERKSDEVASLILLDGYVKFGRSDSCDVVLTSTYGTKNGNNTNMISREHAYITGIKTAAGKMERYMITDHSLNGTYINEFRCRSNEPMPVKEGDILKFGHMNGASVKAGAHAPQANAEFAFVMEKASPEINYLGFRDGRRTKPLLCRGEKHYCEETEIARKLSTMSSGPPSILNTPMNPATTTAAQMMNLFPGVFPYASLNPLAAAGIYGPQFLPNSVTSGFRAPNIFAPYQNTFPGLPATTAANVFNRSFLGAQPQLINQLLTSNQQMSGMMPGVDGLMTGGVGPVGNLVQEVKQPQEKQPEKPAVASPPMECDSSVPSPPKPTRAKVESLKSKEEEEQSDRSYADSPVETRLPEWNHRTMQSPDSDSVMDNKEKILSEVDSRHEEVKKEPATSTSTTTHAVKARKTNEVAQLLSDLTETSFANQMRRTSTRRPTEEERLEKNAKKEKKKKEKAQAKVGRLPGSYGSAVRSRMKQLSDEESITSDSDSEPKRKTVITKARPLKKRKARSSESEESDSDDSTKKRKKSKMTKKFPVPKKPATVRKDPKSIWKARAREEEEATGSSANSADEDATPMMLDTGEGCDMGKACKRPVCTTIQWVQCDDCDGWFHNFCILGSNKPLAEDSFSCGCAKKSSGKEKTRK